MNFRIKTFIRPDGERYCVLLDETGMPEPDSTLFVTSQIRNRNESTAKMEQALTAIKVLFLSCGKQGIDLKERIQKKAFLTTGEMDAIRDDCLEKRRITKMGGNVISLKNGYKRPIPKVTPGTQYIYITHIAGYVEWLCKILLDGDRFTQETSSQVEEQKKAILARRPMIRNRNSDDESNNGLTHEQEDKLFEIMDTDSPLNPFVDPGVRFRNYLMLKLLRILGPRGGELLNIQINDFDWKKNTLKIVRRADSRDDTRTKQAKVKTNQRVHILTQENMNEIREYIVDIRKRILNSDSNKYLFVTHKSCPTQGQPLSISSLQAMFGVIATAFPDLKMHPHMLRYTWNDRYSESMEGNNTISHTEIEERRKFLQGWSPNSKMGDHYNKRYIRKTAHEASLKTQEDFNQDTLATQAKQNKSE